MANSERAFSLAAAVRQAVGDKPLEVSGQVVQIPRDQITPNEANFYGMADLEELATSIQLTGLIHPIIVRPAEGGGYVITDGERRYRATGILEWPTVPAIVRTPVNAVLEELALIEANRQSRRLTDAELSKQAERLQELLVALKESGVEIPGRIRTAVSEAMQISESKLARLKKIRADLAPQYLAMFDTGQLNESISYELAKLPQDRQELIAGHPDDLKKKTLQQVQGLAEYASETIRGRECPRGGTCQHETSMFNHDKGQKYTWNWRCSGVSCCARCGWRLSCNNVCPICKDDVQKEKKERENREEKRLAEDQRLADERKAAADRDWARMGALREAAGISLEDERLIRFPGLSDYKSMETQDGSYDRNRFPEQYTSFRALEYYADLFGVSLDVLVGRESPQTWLGWRLTAETPPEAGRPVIFWGSKGLRTPPAAAISNYIATWPDEYAWWAYVSPPPDADLQPAGAYADADGLAPASEDPDKTPEINPAPGPVLGPGA